MAGTSLARWVLLVCWVPLVALLMPATASAAVAPTVTIASPSQQVTATQELVAGTVNPHGLSTTYQVWYAPATASWCTSQGTSGTYSQTSGSTLQFTDSSAHAVSVAVSGLTSGTTYCAEIAATNAGGTSVSTDEYGNVVQVTFTAGDPAVTSTTASATGPQQVTVQGTVEPATQSTTYAAVYDLATSTWCETGGQSGSPAYETAPLTLPYEDDLAHDVTVNITDTGSSPLIPNTSYCGAIAAANPSSNTAGAQVIGTVNGVQMFTTEPAVTTVDVKSTSATSAELSGSVNPDDASTTYYAAYSQVSSDWCQSDGASGSPSYQTPPQTLGLQDLSAHAVTVEITGLTTGATYCVSLRSDNAPLGVSDGGLTPSALTVGLPSATTSDVIPDAPTTALLDGSVGPAGQATTYDVVYALQSSTWCQSGGATGSPTYSTAPQALPQSETDSGVHDVTVEATNLTPGVRYCAALAAQNGSNGQSGSPSPSVGSTINFTAGIAPTTGDSQVTDQDASTSVVTATANPEGQSTSYYIAYANIGSNWCNGGSGAPDGTTAAQPLSPSDTNDHQVTATITGLQGGVTYCAAIVATNNSGSSTGPQTQFMAGQPSATATATDAVSPTSQSFSGTVDPTGQATQYYVVYDNANSLWCQNGGTPASASFSTSPVDLGALDDADHDVTVTITGLLPGESYCAELVAANGSAVIASSALPFTAGFPFTASTSGIEDLTPSSVTVDGVVNPADLGTTYWIAYDLQSSAWCASGGSSSAAGQATAPISLPAADTSDHDVTVSVTGLTPDTDYCAELMAENAMGTITGGQVSFTTSPSTDGGGGSGSTGGGSGGDTGGSTGGGDGGSPPVPTPVTGGSPARATVSDSITSTGSGVEVPVTCPATSSAGCRVTVTLTATETTKSRNGWSQRRTVTVGTASETVAPGARGTLAVSLNAAGRRLLRALHGLKVRLSATQNGASLTTRSVKLSARRARHKTHRR